ncbi:MAG TPA: nuclear transport factor 2 family protein [Solirubrobacterales bacterium]
MSAENVETVRRLVEAIDDRDLDALLAELHPDAELQTMRAQLEGTAYRGHEGTRQMLADFERDWEYVRIDAEEFLDAGEAVVVLGRLQTRGRTSRVNLDVPMGILWRLRDGKAVHGKTFSERADAPRAAGLE